MVNMNNEVIVKMLRELEERVKDLEQKVQWIMDYAEGVR